MQNNNKILKAEKSHQKTTLRAYFKQVNQSISSKNLKTASSMGSDPELETLRTESSDRVRPTEF